MAAATTNFFNMSRATVKNSHAGYTQKAYLAPRSWFDELQTVAGTYGADAATIATDHTFLAAVADKNPGGGFIQLYVTPNTIQGSSASTSDPGSLLQVWKGQLFIPGDDPELQQLVEKIQNEDLIIIIQDASNGQQLIQYGSDGLEAHITKADFASGQTNTGKKGWSVEFEAPKRYFYNGAITVMA